jgi:UDP-N-acetylmuramate: L-alanyl-gamma-D-glutamyl-meso-diaminopimelate ligase
MGVHKDSLTAALQGADEICMYQPEGLDWNLDDVISSSSIPARLFSKTGEIIDYLVSQLRAGDHVLIMSNGGFEGLHGRLLEALEAQAPQAQ